MPKKWLIVVGVILVMILVAVLLLTGVIPGLKKLPKAVAMEFWGINDERAWREIIADYEKQNPGLKINYRRFSPDTYEQDLVNALAAGRGPDVLMFQHNWLPKHASKITPATPEIFSVEKLKTLFPTVVEQDFAPFGSVYALPLYIDTLALLYNKDIFDKVGIALPPKSWGEFQVAAKKLGLGRTALGGSGRSIFRASEILSLLMLQDGTAMTDEKFTRASFARSGLAPFNFYLGFSDPKSPLYSWNDSQGVDLEGLANGNIGMAFGFGADVNLIKEHSPFLNLGIAAIPQLSPNNTINYPFYYGLAVAASSPLYNEAWKFVEYATTDQNTIKKYLSFVKELPALRALISQAGNTQALSARSWLQADDRAIKDIFSDMIISARNGQEPSRALLEAEEKVNQLMTHLQK